MTHQTTRKSRYSLTNGKGGDRISDVPETLKEIVWWLKSRFGSDLKSVQVGTAIYEVGGSI